MGYLIMKLPPKVSWSRVWVVDRPQSIVSFLKEELKKINSCKCHCCQRVRLGYAVEDYIWLAPTVDGVKAETK